ncbi:MAG: helix-turn-helix domain-containing protein [Beijerinckiaceae bacterium]|nr:helix-turn-helix domain-containing protein [Beijerinckiaceae bacterium]MDO9441011.1 helix-turn-helix transcriptional regulator [Beijerinckiaceae bacterium]
MSTRFTPAFGERLKNARLAKNMSLNEVARAVGVSFGAVAKWENGRSRPRLDRLAALGQVLHIAPADLLQSDAGETPESVLLRAQMGLAALWHVSSESIEITVKIIGG